MSSTNQICGRILRGNVPGSIVMRATIAILGLSMVLGLVFAFIVSSGIEHRERNAAASRLSELLSTVEATARVACFLGDRKLATEIGTGLLRTRIVAAVRIDSGGLTIFEGGQTDIIADPARTNTRVERTIYSPFDSAHVVGQILIYPNEEQISAAARSLSHDWTVVLVLQAALVAAGVALAVYVFVTRPIRRVSRELHLARSETGRQLKVPFGNDTDEIGILVTDINRLISTLTRLLGTERELRVELKRAEQSARSQAEHDPLTGLLNRRGMDKAVDELFARATAERGCSFACLQIDLDRFKAVNDNHGHEAGDLVLRHVARLLERGLRSNDLIARPGGDEFQAILMDISDPQTAYAIASTLIGEISQPVPLDSGASVHIGASIGIAFATPADRTALPVMRRADAALYTAKQAGRGRASFAPQNQLDAVHSRDAVA